MARSYTYLRNATHVFQNNVEVHTPIKRKKWQNKLSYWGGVYSTVISSVKQAIGSFNNWIIEKTKALHQKAWMKIKQTIV